MQAIDDKRLFQRFSARFPAKIKDSRSDYGSGVFLEDASAQGARILSKDKMFLDDRVSVEVKLPDGFNPLIISGKVVWSKLRAANLWEVGIQFPHVDFMRLHRLYKEVEE